MTNEKEWVVLLTYGGKEHQLNQDEYERMLKNMQDKTPFMRLKDGTILGTRPVAITKNPKYISPRNRKKIRMKREFLQEYQQLKRAGKFSAVKEYLKWKLKKRKKDDKK